MKVPGGIFISLEGIEGSGKTTQARLLAEGLRARGFEVVLTREPGGTVIGDRVRDILLDPGHGVMSGVTELLLYNAARSQHLEEVVKPSLGEGSIVITDRFTDSTIAYQGYGREIDLSVVMGLDGLSTRSFRPQLTVLLDLDAGRGLSRNRRVNKVDRLELEDLTFHQRVRTGFLEMARTEPGRFVVIDASLPADEVRGRVWDAVTGRIAILC